MDKITLTEVTDEMKEQQIFLDEISLSGTSIYTFEDIVFDDDMRKVLRHFIINGKMDGEDILAATDWELETPCPGDETFPRSKYLENYR